MIFYIFQGSLHLYNFALNGDKYLPTFILGSDIKYCLMAKITGKTSKSKGLVHLFTVKTYGEIQK